MALLRTLALALATLTLAGSAATAARPLKTAREYVARARADALYNRYAAQYVLQTTANPAVRRFAKSLLADNARLDSEMAAAGVTSQLGRSDAAMDAAQVERIRLLAAATGPTRDRIYLDQLRTSQPGALASHRTYAARGALPPLRTAALRVAPLIESHLVTLETMPNP